MERKPIILLTNELANMISAGEVVERPLSVVKELVENSIDASANKIKIELQDSGLKTIKVTDNGVGMLKEEIPLALCRHATSKITNKYDLFSITSLGFRGEALPSIASVSKMRITSSVDGQSGYFVEYLNSEIVDEGLVAFPKGTKIEVADLFYNTPARYKHLSNLNQELSHIMNFLNRIVIAYPAIAFTVINNDKTLLQTLGDSDLTNIIAQTYGTDIAKNMLSFSGNNNMYQITGFTSKNNVFRSNKNSINIIVNKRIIRNQQLIYAITDSYKTILPVGKYPITILEITTDPSLIDVNVHPSKLEIRFTDELTLRRLVTRTITEVLHHSSLVYEINLDNKQSNYLQDNSSQDISYSETSLKKEEPIISDYQESKHRPIDELWSDFNDLSPISPNEETVIPKPSLLKEEKVETISHQFDQKFFGNFHYIGQYNKTYLIFEHENNLYLIDQHAAMERCMYEKISKAFQTKTNESFELLIPIHLDFNSSEIMLIEDKMMELNEFGIIIEIFGKTSILVRSIPTWIPKGLEKEFIYDIVNHLITNQKTGKEKMYDSLAKMMSCKKSIKAHMAISELEITHLLHELDACQMPYTCPHGRPTFIKLSLHEIEKLFKRVM